MKTALSRRSVPSPLLVLGALAMTLAGQAVIAAANRPDACSLLTKEEIQEAVGQPVQAGKLNTSANPAVGQPCEFKVGDYGVFSILSKIVGPGETADAAMAQLKKMGMKYAEIAGLGDRSFSFDAGYGMYSLNTFKGSTYLIITLLVPGLAPDTQKACAEKLMRKALSRI